MKIAVLSDIHGNHHALKACIEVALKNAVNTFIFLGDYLGEFAYPQKTMEILYEMKDKYQCYFVRGNKEDYSLDLKQEKNSEWRNGGNEIYGIIYNYESLRERDFEFFSSLPISQTLFFEGFESITCCHGSIKRNTKGLLSLTEEMIEEIKECKSKYILCGHTHVQKIIEVEGKIIINPGAVGVALHSSNGESRFTILESKGQEWTYELMHVNYDKEKVVKELNDSGLYEKSPCWCRVTENLIRTGETSHGSVLDEAIRLCKEETGSCIWYDIPHEFWERALVNMGIN